MPSISTVGTRGGTPIAVAALNEIINTYARNAIDPVTGFQIPSSWIKLCTDSEALQKIQSGRWVLLSNGLLLKRGLTTGTTAAAACKGAVLSLNRPIDSIEVMTPVGIRVSLTVVAKEGFLHCRQRWRRPPVRHHQRPGDSGSSQSHPERLLSKPEKGLAGLWLMGYVTNWESRPLANLQGNRL